MKKIIGAGFIMIFGLLGLTNVFAECKTCNATPSKVEKYISNMKSAVSGMGGSTSNSSSSSSSSAYTGFGSGIRNKMKKAGNNTYDSINSSLNFSMNMTSAFGSDLFGNFKVVFNSDSAIRDWKKVIALDKTIGDKIYRIGRSGDADKQLTESEASKISGKLKNLGPISSVTIKEGATYGQVAGLLWDINTLYKNMYLEFSNTNRKSEDHRENVLKIQKKYETIVELNVESSSINDYVEGLQSEYECSTTNNKCPGGFEEFKKDIKQIMKYSMKDVTKSIDKFKESYQRLKEALLKLSGGYGDTTKSFESRKKELLNRYYGNRAKDIVGFTGAWGVGKARQQLKEEVVDPARNMVESVDQKMMKANKTPASKDKVSQIELGIYDTKYTKEQFKQSGRQTIDTIYRIHDSKQTDIAIQNPSPVSSLMPEVSKQVYAGINQIGDQDKDGSIVKNMGDACDKQCSNHGGKCRDDSGEDDQSLADAMGGQ